MADEHKMQSKFEWVYDFDLTPEMAKEFGIIKGVCMREGPTKDNTIMSMVNIIEGAGAIRAASLLGSGNLNIDHRRESNEAYEKKYPGISEMFYPCGFLLDAQAVEADDGKWVVEYLGICENRVLYNLIDQHKVVGNSVEDYRRKEDCSDCSGNVCNCHPEGSTFIDNAIILEEVPNADGTWVDTVGPDDIGTILTGDANALPPAPGTIILNRTRHATPLTPLAAKLNKMAGLEPDTPANAPASTTSTDATIIQNSVTAQTNPVIAPDGGGGTDTPAPPVNVIDNYLDDGDWDDGARSIRKFLTGEKDISKAIAKPMSEYLDSNPKELPPAKLDSMSGTDIEMWWKLHALQTQSHGIVEVLKSIKSDGRPSQNAAGVNANNVSDYMDGDQWAEGADSIKEFLMEEKGISESDAAGMAEYLYVNPTAISPTQLQHLSTLDLEVWWSLFMLKRQVSLQAKRIASLEWLRHNAIPLKALRNTKHTRETAHFHALESASSVSCAGCKWFAMSSDAAHGHCQAIPDTETDAAHVCDLHEPMSDAKPAAKPDPVKQDTVQDPAPSKAGQPASDAAPPADDASPEPRMNVGTEKKPVYNVSRPIMEPHPSAPVSLDAAERKLDDQIATLNMKLAAVKREMSITPMKGRHGRKLYNEYERLKAEHDRLVKLKKK